MKTVSIILIAGLISCAKQSEPEVHVFGALKNYRSGDISGKFNLSDLTGKQAVYGLGAVAKLKGEIFVWDNEITIASVQDNQLHITSDSKTDASLFVYSEVSNWQTESIQHIESLAGLELEIAAAAQAKGLSDPFPFLLQGTINSLDWHVINWDENRTDHNPQSHKSSGLSGQLEKQPVKIIGFYSTKHKAIFTHHDSNIHLHVLNDERDIAGHVDALSFTRMQISFPNGKK